jgi:NADH-quinone oxidoreductase subunit G
VGNLTVVSDLVTITVNGVDLEVPKGELIVESVKRLGLEIPIFCYHPRMKPVGMCRMCLVEVGFKGPDGSLRMMPKPQAGCTLPADANMVVFTDTESVRKDRKGVLEFLLINHPLDCPICDRGGECPLQNNTLFYGPSTSRFVEAKRHLPKAFPLSKYVTLDLERCIQCGRCVRFTEEISGDGQLAFLFRGAQMTPQTFELSDFDSKFSGNVIEICPVGALTSSEYRFRARPWDLQTRPAICTECSNGCATWFDFRVDKMVRINGRTNEAVNEEWTCDRGKFGHEWLNSPDRLSTVLVREGSKLRQAGWGDAYERLIPLFGKGGSSVAGLCGGRPSNEDLFLFKRLFNEHFESENLDSRWYAAGPTSEVASASTMIASIEDAPTIVLFGGNLAEEQPIVFLRVRKAWFKKGAKVIVASTDGQEADAFASHVVRYAPGAEQEAIRALKQQISGDALVIASRTIYNSPNGAKIAEALNGLGKTMLLATTANEQGAIDIGLNTGNTRQILEDCKAGKVKALWLLQADPFSMWHDRTLVQQALESVEFLVVQDAIRTEAMEYASVVLPCCAFSERDGSYTNCERRVQSVAAIMAPKGSAKPSWKVFAELMLRLGTGTPPFSAREVFRLLCETVPAFHGAAAEELRGEGWPLEMQSAAGERAYAKR